MTDSPALRRLLRLMHELFHDSAVLSAVTAPDGTCLWLNPVFEAVLEHDAAHVVGQHFGRWVDPVDAERMQVCIGRLVSGATHTERVAHTVVSRTGRQTLLDATLTAHRDDHGNLLGVVGQALNITEHDSLRTQLKQVRNMMDAASFHGGIGLWMIDVTADKAWWNDVVATWLGRRPDAETPLQDVFAALLPPEDLERIGAAVTQAFSTGFFDERYRLRRADGALTHVLSRARVHTGPDGHAVLYGAMTDVTEVARQGELLQTALDDLRTMHDRLRNITDTAPSGLYEFLRSPSGHFSAPYVNAGFERLTGVSAAAVAQDAGPMFARVHPDDVGAILSATERSYRQMQPWKERFRMVDADGQTRWIVGESAPQARPDGSVVWYGSLHDITEDIRMSEALETARRDNERMAQTDALTGLANRRHFDTELVRRLDTLDPEVPSTALTLIRIDLDDFKRVNDTLGHDAGDAVLRHVAGVLRSQTRKGDFVARVGGDEFVILMAPGQGVTGPHGALALIDRLQKALEAPVVHAGQRCRFGISFGVASSLILPGEADRLLTYADLALYDSKTRGKGCTTICSPELLSQTLDERARADALVDALETGQIAPYYHPQIDAATGAVSGFEVLSRWVHPKRGILPPSAFVDVAQRINRLHVLDRVVFERAFEDLAIFRADGLHIPKLSFNVSAARLHDEDFLETVTWGLGQGVRVGLELLETIVLEDLGNTMRMHLDTLRERGAEIEVDDFGSNRASLIGVMRVAPDTIKLDQQLVFPVTDNPKNRAIVRHLVNMLRELDVSVTAEGVETLAHASILRDMGVQTLQGYLYGEPIPADAVAARLATCLCEA